WTDELDPWHQQELADLLKSDLGLAASDDRPDTLAIDPAALRHHRFGNAETWKELRGEVRTAHAGRVRDRRRREERPLQRVDRADVGLRRPGPYGHANAGPHEVDAAAPDGGAVLDHVVERGGR